MNSMLRAGFGALSIAAVLSVTGAFAQPVAAVTSVRLDGRAGGKLFEGVGVVDGGGATSVLLKDYPEPQRSQILDLIYKPKFGASVSALYVEVPGDGNSTQGSMPSHAHTRGDLNYWRGYTWWVMREARRRNRDLSLDGAAWSAPGWIGDRGQTFAADDPFFSRDGVDYYVSWLKGLKSVHGLELDALGIRNEKGDNYAFAEALKRALDANRFSRIRVHGFDNWQDNRFAFVSDMAHDPALRSALDVLSAHVSPNEGSVVAPDIQRAAARMGKPLWDTEQHVYEPGYTGLINTVHSLNLNFIQNGMTKIIDWYGIAGLYTMEPYSGEKEALVRANWPWSGHYAINEKLWAFAHYGQFSKIGWSYLNGGSGALRGGGTYVTLAAPKGGDYSVIVETKGASAPQRLRLDVSGLSEQTLALWRSDAGAQFVRQPDVAVADGTAELELEPDAVYSLTTTRGQQKGGFDAPPEQARFPFPYADDFDSYRPYARSGYLPQDFADIYGAFELSDCPGRPGGCLHQAAPVRAISWAPDWLPYSVIGDDHWRDYDVGADVYLKPGDEAGVLGRVNSVGAGYGVIPKGYSLRLKASGDVLLSVVKGKIDKAALVGDAEQQALIKASGETGEGGERVLARTHLDGIAPGQWHALRLRFQGPTITGLVDGRRVLSAQDATYGQGMAGLIAGRGERAMSTPFYDNLTITAPGGQVRAATAPRPPIAPLYPSAR